MSVIVERFPILKNPASGFLVLVLAITSLATVGAFQEGVELPKLIVWLTGLGTLLFILVFSKPQRVLKLPKWLGYLSVPFFIFLVLGPIFSLDPINSIFGTYPRFINSAIFFLTWWVFIIVLGFYSVKEKYGMLQVLVLMSGLIGLWGIIQSFGFGYYGGLYEGVRSAIPSFLGNPNFSSMFVVVTIPVQVWLLSNSKNRSALIYYFAIFAISLVSLMIFNSRGAMLGLAAAMISGILILIYSKKFKWAIFVGSIFVLSAASYWTYYQITRVEVPTVETSTSDRSIGSRWLIWEIAANEIAAHPLFGHGFGNYFLAFRASQHPALTSTEWFDDAHSVILQQASSAGLPLTLSMLAIIGAAALASLKRWFVARDAAAGAVAASIAIWLLVGSFTPVSLPNWILLAVLTATGLSYISGVWSIGLKFWLKSILIMLGIGFIVFGGSMLASELMLRQSGIYLNAKDYSAAELMAKKSVSFYPYNMNARLSVLKAQLEQGKHDLVEAGLEQLQDQHPSSAGVYQSVADYYIQMYQKVNNDNYRTKAVAATQNMIAHNGNYEPTLRVAVINMIRTSEFQKANEYARRAIVFDDGNYNTWLFLAQTEFYLQDREGTLHALAEAFKINPHRRLKGVIDSIKQAPDLNQINFPNDL
ncbi:O-antigen ligase family protein [bacterium]|nr:MAG: O-antigen ligase family protein [bacterium]